jgi:hypothetical protein
LCVELGYCLTPRDCDAVEENPPTDPQAFAELVMKLEGVGSGDAEMLMPVLERVLKAFEEAASATARESSTLE